MVFESIWTILPRFQWFFLWHGKEPNAKTNQHKSLFISTLLFHIHSMSNIGQNLFHFSCFLVLLFIFPLVKTFRVIYGFMCYYCYRWNLCAQTFFIVPLLAVYSTALLCKLEEYRMVFIGYLNTRVEINKKYDAKNGIR